MSVEDKEKNLWWLERWYKQSINAFMDDDLELAEQKLEYAIRFVNMLILYKQTGLEPDKSNDPRIDDIKRVLFGDDRNHNSYLI